MNQQRGVKMRDYKILISLLVILLVSNCNYLVPLEPQNLAPNIPQNIYPANDTTDVQVNVTFIWSGSDPDDKEQVSFNFYLAAESPEPELIATDILDTTFNYNSLKYNTLYYWKVVARDQNGNTSSSPVWNFSTRYEHNNPPNIPNNPQPQNGFDSFSIQDSALSWSGGDVDSFSVVTYDVHFGKSVDSLKLLSESQKDTFLAISNLEFKTQYFWKIVAKDHYGLITEGPVWSFSTESAHLIFEENFDSYPTDGYPEPSIWTINKSGANLFITDSIAWNKSGKSVCFIDSTESGNCYLATRLPERSVGILEFYCRVTSNNDVFGLRLYSQQAQNDRLGPQISIRQGKLQYYDSSYNWHTVCEIDSNIWYQIQLSYNCHQKFYNIFVNEELIAQKVTWTGNIVPDLNLIYFITFDNRICQRAFLDEIKLYAG
jgi:hypothetical protein